MTTYLEAVYNELKPEQKYFIKLVILKVLGNASKGYICCQDMSDAVRFDLVDNAPGFKWTKVTDHLQAALWDLEAKGEIIRYQQGRHTALKLA